MTLDEQIAILQALKEGEKIEAQRKGVYPLTWSQYAGHQLNFCEHDYRIVPEPRRFVIYSLHGCWYVKPYTNNIPADATIICTALEELPSEAIQPYLDALKQNLARP